MAWINSDQSANDKYACNDDGFPFLYYLVNCRVVIKVKTSNLILINTFCVTARHPKQLVSRFSVFNILGGWWGVLFS